MLAVYGCLVESPLLRASLGWCFAVLCFVPSVAWSASGGPDGYGYTWRDNLSGGPQPDYETGADAERLSLDDDGSTTVLFEPGFTFPFYGQVFSSVTVHNNGGLTFSGSGNLAWEHPCPWQNPGRALIAPFWADLATPSGGVSGVYTWTGGPPGARYFVAEWYVMPLYEHTGTVTFEVKLFAADGRIEFHYDDVIVDGVTVDLGSAAAVGIGASSSFLPVSCDSPSLSNDYAIGINPPACTDIDGDGSCANVDCADDDDDVYPGATEVCDGLDTDCNGSLPLGELDIDRDGYGTCQDDCDDSDAAMTPADLDGDLSSTCTGDCDDGDATANPFDDDGDGRSGCEGDCDDDNPLVGAIDGDGDGHSSCDGDCDDDDAEIHPEAGESCDGVDEDCDGEADDGLDCENDETPTLPPGHEIPYGCILDTSGAALLLPFVALPARRRRARR